MASPRFVIHTGTNGNIVTMSSDSAQIDLGRNLALRGHVTLSSERPECSLRVHSLYYFVRSGKITTPDKVMLHGTSSTWEGIGMIVRPVQGRLQLLSDVRVNDRQGRLQLEAASVNLELSEITVIGDAMVEFSRSYEKLVCTPGKTGALDRATAVAPKLP
jgi:hypothetical protein